MNAPRSNALGNRLLLAVILLLVTALLLGLAVFFGLRARNRAIADLQSTNGAVAVTAMDVVAASSPTSFDQLSEKDMPGCYKWSDGEKVSYITLLEDHTFINKDGTIYPPYLWAILPDRLQIHWQSGVSEFTRIEGSTAFSYVRPDGTVTRLQKLPPVSLPKISMDSTDAIASVTFGETGATNGLTPANTLNDGMLFPSEIGGKECAILGRGRGKMSAFAYFRVADELKTITNALVAVEYFDRRAMDSRNGWIIIQYDAVEGPYTRAFNEAQLSGSGVWTQAVFLLPSPLFQNRQNDRADFRICVANPELPIRAVKLMKNPK